MLISLTAGIMGLTGNNTLIRNLKGSNISDYSGLLIYIGIGIFGSAVSSFILLFFVFRTIFKPLKDVVKYTKNELVNNIDNMTKQFEEISHEFNSVTHIPCLRHCT